MSSLESVYDEAIHYRVPSRVLSLEVTSKCSYITTEMNYQFRLRFGNSLDDFISRSCPRRIDDDKVRG